MPRLRSPETSAVAMALHHHVDLTLAVNYLPACACLGKMLVFMLAVTMIPYGQEIGGFILLAAMLYMDRLVTRNIIFDANAILLAVFFANVHASIRATSIHRAYQGLVDGMFLFWAVGSLVLISEPAQLKRVLDRRINMAKLVPVLLMLLIVVAISHFHSPLESGGVRACRAVAFTLLSFAWIYIVGIHTPHGIEYLKENSCQFVSRLAPVLYTSAWIAVAFTIGAVGAFATQYVRLVASADEEQGKYTTAVQSENRSALSAMPSVVVAAVDPVSVPAQPAEDEEELFRLARMQSIASSARAAGRMAVIQPTSLETIRENP